MPLTPIVSGQKTAFIALVNTVDPNLALRMVDILNYYSDIPTAIGYQLDFHAANPRYLWECMNCFSANDSDMRAAGIYNNNTLSSGITDAVMFVNFIASGTVTYDGDTLFFPSMIVMGNSQIGSIVTPSGTILEYLYIGPGSTVNIFDSTATNSFVNHVYIDFAKSAPGALNAIAFGSGVGSPVVVQDGAYYGGVTTNNPIATCALAVTDLQASDITKDSILLSWVAPESGYTQIVLNYKKINSGTWIEVGPADGDWIYTGGAPTGFVFRNLESQTYYNFEVAVTCNNGGVATSVINAETICCGSGGSTISISKACLIEVQIKQTPSPTNYITLCNGQQILAQYPVGPTLTIPYLIGLGAPVTDLVIGNQTQQGFPYNQLTGTFGTVSPPTYFLDGDVVSVTFNLPF